MSKYRVWRVFGCLMEEIYTIGTMLGFGLGIVAVLYLWYHRIQRMNERNDKLQNALTESLKAIQEQGVSMLDLKSASKRATEMDHLYQENHRAVMNGQTAIVGRLPDAVEELSHNQGLMTHNLETLSNCFATITIELAETRQKVSAQNASFLDELETIKLENNSAQATLVTQLQNIIGQTGAHEHRAEQLSKGLGATISLIESNQVATMNLLGSIQRKMLEDY